MAPRKKLAVKKREPKQLPPMLTCEVCNGHVRALTYGICHSCMRLVKPSEKYLFEEGMTPSEAAPWIAILELRLKLLTLEERQSLMSDTLNILNEHNMPASTLPSDW